MMSVKKNLTRIILPAIAAAALMAPMTGKSGNRIFAPVPQNSLENVTVTTLENGKQAYTITDSSYEKTGYPDRTDLVLSFNRPADHLVQDDTKKYKISSADYFFKKEKGSLGRGCAEFSRDGQGVRIKTSENLWLGSCGDLGSFTVEFRFKAYSTAESCTLFSRTGYLSGIKNGIEIAFKNGKIRTGLYSFFERPDGRKYDIIMNSGRLLKKARWYHFSLSYNRLSGRLSTHLNAQEEEVIYVSDKGKPYINVHKPCFSYRDKNGKIICRDAPPAVIGEGFSGYIDEFRILYRNSDNFCSSQEKNAPSFTNYGEMKHRRKNRRIPVNIEGRVTSPVYSFQGTGTGVSLFNWTENIKKDTFAWMEFRISDHLFYQNNTSLKWYRIKNNQRKIYLKRSNSKKYLRGKYYQWRLHLAASPDGKRSPEIYDIKLNYIPDPAPQSPRFLQVVEAGDRFVHLKWEKNVDSDILGYRIYYGTKPGKYDGVISTVNGRRIDNSLGKTSSIEIKLTDKIISENFKNHKPEILEFPLIRNTVLYYFSVSAYDSYEPDTPYNHESGLSARVSGRPFAGSDID